MFYRAINTPLFKNYKIWLQAKDSGLKKFLKKIISYFEMSIKKVQLAYSNRFAENVRSTKLMVENSWFVR